MGQSMEDYLRDNRPRSGGVYFNARDLDPDQPRRFRPLIFKIGDHAPAAMRYPQVYPDTEYPAYVLYLMHFVQGSRDSEGKQRPFRCLRYLYPDDCPYCKYSDALRAMGREEEASGIKQQGRLILNAVDLSSRERAVVILAFDKDKQWARISELFRTHGNLARKQGRTLTLMKKPTGQTYRGYPVYNYVIEATNDDTRGTEHSGKKFDLVKEAIGVQRKTREQARQLLRDIFGRIEGI